jgi:cell division septal protein FtsQ
MTLDDGQVALARPRVRLPIDPRMRQRLIEVRRAEGRRRLRVVVALVAVLAVVGAAVGTIYSPLLRVRHTRIFGERLVSTASILAASGLDHTQLMVDIAPSSIARRLEAIPRVLNAEVSRQWPGTVAIRITERRAVGLVPAGGGVLLVDASGRVLTGPQTALAPGDSVLPLLIGVLPLSQARIPVAGSWLPGTIGGSGGGSLPVAGAPQQPGAAGRAAAILQLAASMPPVLARVIRSINWSSDGLTATAGNTRAAVVFGDVSQLAAKMAALQAVLTTVQLARVARIDLRVPDRPALTPAT